MVPRFMPLCFSGNQARRHSVQVKFSAFRNVCALTARIPIVALVLRLFVFAVLLGGWFPPAHAQGVICDRTPELVDDLLNFVFDRGSCTDVTAEDLRGLTELSLFSSFATAFKPGDFAGFTNVTILDLDDSTDLSTLPAGVFVGLDSLEFLYLNRTNLRSLRAGVFNGLSSLEWLELEESNLSSLSADVFDSIPALTELQLGYNNLRSLPAGVFDKLTLLSNLNLSNNSLSALRAGVFAKLTSLRALDLSDNNLSALPADVFVSLTGLQTLKLGGVNNSLTTLPVGVFDPLFGVVNTLDVAQSPTLPLSAQVGITGGDHVRESQTYQVTFSLLSALPFGVIVPYTVTLHGGATSADFDDTSTGCVAAVNGSATIAAGMTTATVDFCAAADSNVETSEHFIVTLGAVAEFNVATEDSEPAFGSFPVAKLVGFVREPTKPSVTVLIEDEVDEVAFSYDFDPDFRTLRLGTAVNIPVVNAEMDGITYMVSGTTSLPEGLTLSATTGAISGTPTAVNNLGSRATIKGIRTSDGGTGTAEIRFPPVDKGRQVLSDFSYSAATATLGDPAPTVNSPEVTLTPPNDPDGAAYSPGELAYTTTTSSRRRCTVDSASGMLTLLDTGTCSVRVTAEATATHNRSSRKSFNITVSAAEVPVISYSPPASLTVGVGITDVVPTNTGGAVVSYAATTGELPAGLELHTSTGVISGTPTTANTATTSVTVTATNSGGEDTANVTFPAVAKGTQTLFNFMYSATTAILDDSVPTVAEPTVTLAPNVGTQGDLNYSSTNINICTVDPGSGALTLLSAGSCEISVTAAATATHAASTALTFIIAVSAAPVPVITYTPPASLTVGVEITPIVPGNTGGAVVSYAATGELPAGLNLDTNTGVISGTPTTAKTATTSVTVTATNSGGEDTANVTFPAVAKGTQTLFNFMYSATTAILDDSVPTVTEEPTVTLAPNVGTQGDLNYSSTNINICTVDPGSGALTLLSAGNCVISVTAAATATHAASMALTFTITVSAAPVPVITYTLPASLTVGVEITPIVPTNTGGVVVSYAATTGELPMGLELRTSTGVISGTPTTANTATTSVTITATNSGGMATAIIEFPAVAKGTQTLSGFQYSATTAILDDSVPTVTGPTVVLAPDVGSHGDLNYSSTNINICTVDPGSGALTLLSAGSCEISVTAAATATHAASTALTFIIAVSAADVPVITYTPPAASLTVGVEITPIVPTNTGGAVVSYAATTGELPAGLELHTSTGVISGTPTTVSSATTSVTITATNSGGIDTAIIAFPAVKGTQTLSGFQYSATTAILDDVVPTVTEPTVVLAPDVGTQGDLNYSSTNTNICSVDPGSGGLTLVSAGSCEISVIAVETATHAASTALIFIIAVSDADVPVITYTPPAASLTVGVEITPIVPTNTGGAVVSYAATTGELPAGLELHSSSGVISGTPTTANTETTSVTITATNSSGEDTAIIAFPAVSKGTQTLSGLSYSATTAILDDVVPTVTEPAVALAPNVGTQGDLNYSSTNTNICTVDAGSGELTLLTEGSCVISVIAAVTATHAASASVTFTITVSAAPVPVITYTPPASLTVGVGIADIIPVSTGGAVVSYAVTTGELPAGLNLDTNTGVISGTPTTASSAPTSVTITATNSGGMDTAIIAFPAVKGTQTLSGFLYSATTAILDDVVPTVTEPAVALAPNVGTQGDLNYSSTNTNICTVDATSGALALVTEGSCVISVIAVATATHAASTALTFTITVSAAPVPDVSYTPLASLTVGVGIADIIPVSTGGAVVSYAATTGELPAGLRLDSPSGVISGTPTTVSSATTSVTITATNSGGMDTAIIAFPAVSKGTQTLSGFQYSAATATLGGGTVPTVTEPAVALAPNVGTQGDLNYSSTNTNICTVDPASGALALLTEGNCVIRVIAAATATHAASASVTFTITVSTADVSVITYTPPASLTVGVEITPIVPVSTGGAVVSYAVTTGELPAGLNLDTNTGVISGTPTTASSAPTSVTITATNSSGGNGIANVAFPAVAKGTQTLSGFLYSATTAAVGENLTLTPPTTVFENAVLTYSTVTTGVCAVTTAGVLSLTAAGTCIVTVNAAATANYNAATRDFEIAVTVLEPEVTIAADTRPVTEGTPASFTITLDVPAPVGGLTLHYTVTDDAVADYVASENEGARMVTIHTTTTIITVPTVADVVDEPDGAVTVTLDAGTGYTVGTVASAMVGIIDDDAPSCAGSVAVGGQAAIDGGLVDDCSSLLAARDRLQGNGVSVLNWSLAVPIHLWVGVTVANGRVTELMLNDGDLDGIIPARLGELTALKILSLQSQGNTITGPIPPELSGLTNLEILDLSDNGLDGEIPGELGELANLETLDLSDNGLGGEIPAELGELANLEMLDLSDNGLGGEIPGELGELTNLETLDLSDNGLGGEIPGELGELTNLEMLDLSDNGLGGEIPVKLGELMNLEMLDLSDNGLEGTIPAALQEFAETIEDQQGDAVLEVRPAFTIAARHREVTEGDLVTFIVLRTGGATEALELTIRVADADGFLEDSSMTTFLFPKSSADTAALRLRTMNDGVDQPGAAVVSVTIVDGGDRYDLEGGVLEVSAEVQILDNDDMLNVSVADMEVEVDEEVGTVTISVTGSVPATTDLHFLVTTEDGSAKAGEDYKALNHILTLAAAEMSADVTIMIMDDLLAEEAESFQVVLSEPIGGFGADSRTQITLANSEATVTIKANDEESLLAEPRLTAAAAMLRRHATRFGNVTGDLVRDRLNHRGKQAWNLRVSDAGSDGSVVLRCSSEKQAGLCAWLDGVAAGFGSDTGGKQFDVYTGVDYFSENHVIGILASVTSSALTVQGADYDAAYREVGVYGGTRLGGSLILDAALSYAESSSEVRKEVGGQSISADFASERITLRAALTGSNGWAYSKGSWEIAPRAGILYIQEDLESFRDSARGYAPSEQLQLGQVHLAPLLRWRNGDDEIVVEIPVQWNFQEELQGNANVLSASIKFSLQFRLQENLLMRLQGDYDGLGVNTYESYGLGVTFDYLVSKRTKIGLSGERQRGALGVGLSLQADF